MPTPHTPKAQCPPSPQPQGVCRGSWGGWVSPAHLPFRADPNHTPILHQNLIHWPV